MEGGMVPEDPIGGSFSIQPSPMALIPYSSHIGPRYMEGTVFQGYGSLTIWLSSQGDSRSQSCVSLQQTVNAREE